METAQALVRVGSGMEGGSQVTRFGAGIRCISEMLFGMNFLLLDTPEPQLSLLA